MDSVKKGLLITTEVLSYFTYIMSRLYALLVLNESFWKIDWDFILLIAPTLINLIFLLITFIGMVHINNSVSDFLNILIIIFFVGVFIFLDFWLCYHYKFYDLNMIFSTGFGNLKVAWLIFVAPPILIGILTGDDFIMTTIYGGFAHSAILGVISGFYSAFNAAVDTGEFTNNIISYLKVFVGGLCFSVLHTIFFFLFFFFGIFTLVISSNKS